MASGYPPKGGGPHDRTNNRHDKRAAGADVGEAIRQMIVDKVNDTVASKLAHTTAKHNDKIDKLAPVARDVLDLWTRQSPRARRPRFTRDEIAQAALHIADTEGFDALSMRRLAIELDAGTMTLYHYIRTKDELLALVMDELMGELILDDAELIGGWRAALTAIANASRRTFERHPWVFDVHEDPAVGPNGVRHFDQSLQAVASLEISIASKIDIISAVDEYVFGHALQRRNNYPDFDEHSREGAEMIEYVTALSKTGDYPQITKLIAELGGQGTWDVVAGSMRDSTRFDRNLRRLLDGIEGDLPMSTRG
ncbi:MAG: TetR/AcrR family transcriptional regulator [Ilumatobacteraceae bacterium]